MNWFYYSLLALSFFVGYNLLSRKLAVKAHNPRAFTIVFNASVAILAIFFAFFEKKWLINITRSILLLTILGLINWSLFARLEFAIKKIIEISVLSVVTKIAPVVTLIMSGILLGEKISINKILAIFLIFFANFLLLHKNEHLKLNKNFIWAIIFTIVLGLGWMFDKVVSTSYSLFFYCFLTFGFPSLINALTPPIELEKLTKEFRISSWQIIFLAFLNLFGYYFMLKAFSLGEVSKVSTITSSSVALTILLGIVILKERQMIKRKIMAGILVFLAVLLLK